MIGLQSHQPCFRRWQWRTIEHMTLKEAVGWHVWGLCLSTYFLDEVNMAFGNMRMPAALCISCSITMLTDTCVRLPVEYD